MFLSSRDIKWAINCGNLIVSPTPDAMQKGYDETSIDLHLDRVEEAKVWDTDALKQAEEGRARGRPEVHIGAFVYAKFAEKYLIDPPQPNTLQEEVNLRVFRRGPEIIVQTGGFLLWQTKERVGTPKKNPGLICFVEGKSTRARTGILIHLTAPTIHAGWSGKIVLEIANVGPFDFVLREGDVIAQLTVATVSSPPDLALKKAQSATAGQSHVTGKTDEDSSASRRPRRRRGS
jgi:dCTP deaminase